MAQTAPTDSAATARLIDQAAGGDSQALNGLLARHAASIRGAVRRRLGSQLAGRIDPSDVVQEVQQTAFVRFPDYCRRRPMPFRLWLLRTAHERIVDVERQHLHAQKRSVDRELALPDSSSLAIARQLMALDSGPAQRAMRNEVAGQVRRCLAQLTEADREILMLRTFEGLNNADAATVLRLKPETSKKRFARALLRMRHALDGAGINRSGLP